MYNDIYTVCACVYIYTYIVCVFIHLNSSSLPQIFHKSSDVAGSRRTAQKDPAARLHGTNGGAQIHNADLPKAHLAVFTQHFIGLHCGKPWKTIRSFSGMACRKPLGNVDHIISQII